MRIHFSIYNSPFFRIIKNIHDYKNDRKHFYMLLFIWTISFTYFCHMMIYANYYLGHDASVFWNRAIDWERETGRFFSPFVRQLHNFLQAPWMIACISSILMGIAGVYIVKTLGIRSFLWSALLTACLVSWPSYTASHQYLYSLTQFSCALAASVLSAYYTDRYKWGFLPAIILLVFSLGNYQAYIGLTASILALRMLQRCIEEKSNKVLFLYAVKVLFVLSGSAVLYFLFWHIVLKTNGLPFASYRYMDKPFRQLTRDMVFGIGDVYEFVFHWFCDRTPSFLPRLLNNACTVMVLFCALFMIIRMIRRNKGNLFVRLVFFLMTILLMPLGMNGGHFINPGLIPHPIMLGAMIAPVFLLLSFADSETKDTAIFPPLRYLSYFSVGLLSAFYAACGFFVSNAEYLQMRLNQYRAEGELAGAIARISMEPDYSANTPVAFVLGSYHNSVYEGFDVLRDFAGNGTSLTYSLSSNNQIHQMMPSIYLVDPTPFSDLDIVKKLEEFPSFNCIVWVNDTLVIKIPR